MARISPLMILPPVIFAGLAGMLFFGLSGAGDTTLPSTRIGHPTPKISMTALGSYKLLQDAALRAPGVKLVNFWASWCVPCRVEHPQLEKMAQQGIVIYGVNYKDEPKKALAMLKELGNPYAAIGADANGRNAINWGIYGVPETFIIDSSGTVLLRYPGPITKAVFEKTIKPAIDAAK